MMVNVASSWNVNLALRVAIELGLDVYLLADRQLSIAALDDKVARLTAAGRATYLDFRWYTPLAAAPAWYADVASDRATLESSDAARREWISAIATRYPGALLAPSGPPNDPSRSLLYAREVLSIRDVDFVGRPVYASVTLDKQGLQDASVLAALVPPRDVDGIVLTIVESGTYPSSWAEEDWFIWLRLIGSLRQNGYGVILPQSDFRGLVARGLSGAEFSSGFSNADRQAARDAASTGGAGGPSAPITYFSAPLLAPLHGPNLAVDVTARAAGETHQACGIFGTLAAPAPTGTFDVGWTATGRSVSDQTTARIRRHVEDLHAVDAWIQAQTSPVDATEALLTHAEGAGSTLAPDVFRLPATRVELSARLRAFQRARQVLGI